MIIKENQKIECKREYVADIKKEVIAFANSDGGTIYIGIQDDGIPCGVTNPDNVMLQVANSLKDSIAPDVMPFVTIEAINMDNMPIIRIQVSTGINRPYYIREKGLKPSGVYVRKGSSSQPVSEEGIRQ